ncbi:hypothetical protein [Bacteroides reticulotermitis]|uniref:Uncharacterized protein n=1 Tax=Bacteroides reticulotermitis TaxID=1133319 RepID=A0A840D253_9BACE|nr:hypothetical protein [Bacteroides reticulotermitis]MBB4046140.1 hypothetical protein [Bacteroides reticulotermitis]
MSRGLMILNVILIIQYSVFREQFQGSTLIHQLPAVLVLLNLYYHICNLQPGIILPERVVRTEHIRWRVVRDILIFSILSICVRVFFSFESLSPHIILSFTACLVGFRLFICNPVKQREQEKNMRRVAFVGSNQSKDIEDMDSENGKEYKIHICTLAAFKR